MIDAPRIIQTTTQPAAKIHLVIPKDQIQHVMGPGISEVMSTVAAQKIEITGPWFTHHLQMYDAGWDFEICVPVARPVAAAGRVQAGEWPAMKVARTIYHGPYEGLGDAWGEFLDWIEAGGHRASGDLYECYLAGPESGSDPSAWPTELSKPILS